MKCDNCIHKDVCLHKSNIQTDTYAYMGVKYDTENCQHFIHNKNHDVINKRSW